MRLYLELIETPEEGETGEPDFIRIDTTEWSEEDRIEAEKIVLEYARSNLKHYIVQWHYCRHDEGDTCYVSLVEQR